MVTSTAVKTEQPGQIDLSALKTKQHGAWSSGDYAVVGTTLQIVGEELCEALDLRAGQKVLDVAAGNGNASLAAARRWCEVISTTTCQAARTAARRGGRPGGAFQEADAEALDFGDATFDTVLSTFGMMFWTRPCGFRIAAGAERGIGCQLTWKALSGNCSKTPANCRRRQAKSPALWGTQRASRRCSEHLQPDQGREASVHLPLSLADHFPTCSGTTMARR
jgi:SAM-dependent methyltransferase